MKPKKLLTIQRSEFPLKQIVTRKAMLDVGIRTVDLARRLGVSQSTISLIVAGKTRNLAIQQAIAVALKVSLNSLWDMAPRKRRKRKMAAVRPQELVPATPLAAVGGE